MARRTSIVEIVMDDMPIDAHLSMPWLQADFEAGNHTYFEHSTLSCPICAPSRFTLNTGKRSRRTDTADNYGVTLTDYAGLDPATFLPVALQGAGYATGCVGKYLGPGFPWSMSDLTVPPGWDEFHRGGIAQYTSHRWFSNGVQGPIIDNHKTDEEWAKALEVIGSLHATGRPFYLHFAPITPHSLAADPITGNLYTPPARYADLDVKVAPLTGKPSWNEADVSDKPGWLRERHPVPHDAAQLDEFVAAYSDVHRLLRAFDDGFPQLFALLDTLGIRDTTDVLFSGDNGAMFGEHRHDQVKGVPYRESVHNAERIWLGGGNRIGPTSPALIQNLDHVATFCDIAGAAMPDVVDGRSFLPVLEGLLPARKFREWVLIEKDSEAESGWSGSYYGARHWTMIYDGRWVYVEHSTAAGQPVTDVELYDHRDSTAEVDNLARLPEHADRIREFSRIMRRLKAAA